MTKEEYINLANTEPLIQLHGDLTGKDFSVREFTYGVLVPDYNHPLSCVSVANSSLSIDMWVGCKWQCAYCQVQGSNQDLADQGAMPSTPQRRNQFSVDQIIDALVEHPFFIADETVISIGTASTEPFAPGPVTDSTFALMDAFIKRGMKNPFWIVTKGGIPKGRKIDFARIGKVTRGLMISLCWADNPPHIEPVRNNRFLNIEDAKEAGATIAWYLRPLAVEWSGTRERLEMMMLWVKKNYGSFISAIVPGGLRWTEGIERGLIEVHKVGMPEIAKQENEKDLPYDLAQVILELAQEHFPGTPVYFKSSCAITHMLKIPSISSVQVLSRTECEMSLCPAEQRQVCAQGPICSIGNDDAQKVIDRIGIPVKVKSWDTTKGLETDPPLNKFTYALHQVVLNQLGLGK